MERNEEEVCRTERFHQLLSYSNGMTPPQCSFDGPQQPCLVRKYAGQYNEPCLSKYNFKLQFFYQPMNRLHILDLYLLVIPAFQFISFIHEYSQEKETHGIRFNSNTDEASRIPIPGMIAYVAIHGWRQSAISSGVRKDKFVIILYTSWLAEAGSKCLRKKCFCQVPRLELGLTRRTTFDVRYMVAQRVKSRD